MNAKVKRLWLKALRSGRYKQGAHQLKRGKGSNTTYCCLGVLCEVAKAEGVIRSYNGRNGFPPDKVIKWAEMERFNPRLPRVSATKLNDVLQKPFSYIADRIEKYL